MRKAGTPLVDPIPGDGKNVYEVKYTEFDGAHEYINWQGTLAEGLIALLGKQTR